MIIKGIGYWAQIVGAPKPHKFYEGTAKEGVKRWSFDLSIDKETQKKLLEAGMRKTFLRNKGDERDTFLSFDRDDKKADGSEGKPYEIVDAQNQPWDQSKLIGNGSVLNVVVTLNERTFRGEKYLRPGAIRIQVWEHVPYEGGGKNEFPTKEAESEETQSDKKEW